jgi:5-formaminoimidazole-4-carboxamide-1-beta-D-ribofuranosyl 5'-monophosphate synthetase
MIINRIKEIIFDDFIDFGYDKVTACLRQENLIINPKKSLSVDG